MRVRHFGLVVCIMYNVSFPIPFRGFRNDKLGLSRYAFGRELLDTVVLLTQYAFLWRPLFKDTTQRSGTGYPPTYAYLGAINPDADRLFVYFSQQGVLTYVGGYAFAPMRPRAHPAGARRRL